MPQSFRSKAAHALTGVGDWLRNALKLRGSSTSRALDLAKARGILPTALGSYDVRKQIAKQVRLSSVFSAKTTNARYLHALDERIARLVQGGYNNDPAQLRVELKAELARLGYTPEKGFPGDEALGIEPAKPGSLRDLSSDARIDLILQTQLDLLTHAALKAQGMDGSRVWQFPCWELVRTGERKAPREWEERFAEAGGTLVHDGERNRMMAFKGAKVWAALGNSELFSDALDTDHPPFAIGSGMGWREVHHTDAKKLLGREAVEAFRSGGAGGASNLPAGTIIPRPSTSASGLDAETIRALKAKLEELEVSGGRLTMDEILFGKGGQQP